jgi:hypothetical protein
MSDKIPPVKIRHNTGLKISERKATRIAQALAHGRSIRAICAELHTSHGVVLGVQRNRPDLMEKALTQAREHWTTIAVMTSAELLHRLPNMDTAALVKAAQVSTRTVQLMQTDAPAQEVKSEPAAEAWAQFVAGFEAGNRPQGH